MQESGSSVPSLQSKPPLWMPVVSALNSFCFGVGLLIYLVGFWGGVLSLIVGSAAFPGYVGLFLGGIACGIFTGYLTNYECSFCMHPI